MTILFIDCCIRKAESRTLSLCDAFLDEVRSTGICPGKRPCGRSIHEAAAEVKALAAKWMEK